MHDVFNRMFDGRLVFPPVPRLRRVLDCGFGSASWAMDVAEQYPDCEVRPLFYTLTGRRQDMPGGKKHSTRVHTSSASSNDRLLTCSIALLGLCLPTLAFQSVVESMMVLPRSLFPCNDARKRQGGAADSSDLQVPSFASPYHRPYPPEADTDRLSSIGLRCRYLSQHGARCGTHEPGTSGGRSE
jgi:hypothetical protein